MIRTVRYCFCNTTVLIHFVKGIYSSLVIVIDLKKLKHLQSNLTITATLAQRKVAVVDRWWLQGGSV